MKDEILLKGEYIMKNIKINEFNKLNRTNKEIFLTYLINLEKQEKSNNQVPVSVFHQKDD